MKKEFVWHKAAGKLTQFKDTGGEARRGGKEGPETIDLSLKPLEKPRALRHVAGMKTPAKPAPAQNPGAAPPRQPRGSTQIATAKELVATPRRKKRNLTAEQIHAELDRICKGAPPMDCQAVLNFLRD
jgi:hypothetical protein